MEYQKKSKINELKCYFNDCLIAKFLEWPCFPNQILRRRKDIYTNFHERDIGGPNLI